MKQNSCNGGNFIMGLIEEKVKEIFEQKLFRDLNKCEDWLNESIFGDKIALLPSEAAYLLYEIEEEFNIRLSNDVIIQYRFNILYDIITEIENCTNLT